MGEWDNYCDEIGGVCKDMEAQAARIAELEAENERLRKELNLIGTSADPEDPDKLEPVIMIDKLPSAGTIRELQNLFKELWKN